MPTTKIKPSFIASGSFTGSLLGTASYAITSSYAMNGGSGGTSLTTGSTYPITSSWSNNALTASYAINAVSIITASLQTGSIANQTILYNVTTSQDNVISGLNLTGNKWGITVVEEWNSGSIVGDEYYSSCSILLHFSGSNGSTTFVDNSPNNLTVTGAGASISTVQSKFGGASAVFSGGNAITWPASNLFAYGLLPFTVEFWVYSNSVSSEFYAQTIGGENYFYIGISSGTLYFGFGSGGGTSIAGGSISTGTWSSAWDISPARKRRVRIWLVIAPSAIPAPPIAHRRHQAADDFRQDAGKQRGVDDGPAGEPDRHDRGRHKRARHQHIVGDGGRSAGDRAVPLVGRLTDIVRRPDPEPQIAHAEDQQPHDGDCSKQGQQKQVGRHHGLDGRHCRDDEIGDVGHQHRRQRQQV